MSPYLVDPMTLAQGLLSNTGLLKITGGLLAITMVGNIPWLLVGGLLAFGSLDLLLSSMFYIMIMSLFLPFLNIFISLTFARECARVFNVNVNYLSFIKII
jgi:ABC-type Mn2+/Zn2+ transport system permease subunit